MIKEVLETASPTRIQEIKEQISEIVLANKPDETELTILKLWKQGVDYRIEMTRMNLEAPGSVTDINRIFSVRQRERNEELEFQRALSWLKNNGTLTNTFIQNPETGTSSLRITFLKNETLETTEQEGEDYVQVIVSLYLNQIQ